MQKPQWRNCGSDNVLYCDPEKSSIQRSEDFSQHDKRQNQSSPSLEQSPKTPTEQQGIAELCKSFFDGRLRLSIMESNKETWSIKYTQGDDWQAYKKRFPDRDKRRVKAADWLKHFNNEHVVIVRAGKLTSRFFALDIDQKDILETNLAFELLQIEQTTGLKLYYCRSTSGRGWHVWGFSKKPEPVTDLRYLARWIEKQLSFKIDLVYPCGAVGISAPFTKHRPLFNTQGLDQTPDNIKFNNVKKVISALPVIELPTEPQNATQAKPQPKYLNQEVKKAHVPESMPDYPIPVAVGEALAHLRDKQTFINKFFELYPLQADYRHWLCLLVSADLIKRFGCTLEETVQIIKQAAQAKNDEELSDRLQTVKSTYKRFKAGKRIVNTRLYAKAQNFKTCFFTKTTALKMSRSRLKDIVLKRCVTALYENGFFDRDQNDWQRISKRLLSSIAGIGENKALEALAELAEKGFIKKKRKGETKTTNYFVIGVNKNYSKILPYLIEVESSPTTLDLARTEKKNNKFSYERAKNDTRKLKAKQNYIASLPESIQEVAVVEIEPEKLEPSSDTNTPDTTTVTTQNSKINALYANAAPDVIAAQQRLMQLREAQARAPDT